MPPEMEQIGEEFQLRCGTRSARMGAETFSALLTELGYSGECQRCFRSAGALHVHVASYPGLLSQPGSEAKLHGCDVLYGQWVMSKRGHDYHHVTAVEPLYYGRLGDLVKCPV